MPNSGIPQLAASQQGMTQGSGMNRREMSLKETKSGVFHFSLPDEPASKLTWMKVRGADVKKSALRADRVGASRLDPLGKSKKHKGVGPTKRPPRQNAFTQANRRFGVLVSD